MTKQEQARKMLQVLDIEAPVNINWNNEDLWIVALVMAIDVAEEAKELEAKGS